MDGHFYKTVIFFLLKKRFNNVNVSFAVSTDGGLITPTVNNADDLRIGAIASATKDLISRARVNKLKPEEYSVKKNL